MYDVTKYLGDHPGGEDVLTEAAGADASDAFDSAGHSEDAFDIMQQYLIGTVKGSSMKKIKPKPIAVSQPHNNNGERPNGFSPAILRVINLGLLSVAVTAVLYVARRHGATMPHWLAAALSHQRSQKRGFGFISGILAGGGLLAVINAAVARRFISRIWKADSATSYPPHIKVSRRFEENTLLQRGLLDPATYSALPLRAKTQVAPNVYRLEFSLPTASTILGLPIGQHVTIKADIGGESIARSYTPVSNNSDRGVLGLVVKIYPNGKLTHGYVEGLKVGDEVLFRGPKGAMKYKRGLCKKIGMIAGGTGITPMFQIIRAICEDTRDTTEVSLVYANQTEDSIILRQELDSFARRYPKNFKVHYMLDKPPAEWAFGRGFVTKDLIADQLPSPATDVKIMVCGPPVMIDSVKRSLVDLGFEKPNAMSKMTDQVFVY